MMEWDDYYQLMREKNKNFNVSDGLAGYKSETKAFYDRWSDAERKGKMQYAQWDVEEDDLKE